MTDVSVANDTAAPTRCDPRLVALSVERVMAAELTTERARRIDAAVKDGVDLEACALAMDDFHDWAALYALPTNATTMCAYLVELRCVCGASFEELQEVAYAFLFEHTLRVRVPIIAALEFCRTVPCDAVRAALH
jgi:hypothetical protein